MKKNKFNEFNKEISFLHKKRISSDSKNTQDYQDDSQKDNFYQKKQRENLSFSTDSLSHYSGQNIYINLRGNCCQSWQKENGNNLSIIYIFDNGVYFKKENEESIRNKIEYGCFIEKNKFNEIYFYQYARYNIDDISDNIYCFKCNDKDCTGLITLNYNKNKENKDIIFEHSFSNKNHSYIQFPTYGYQIYIDAIKQNNTLNYIQLVNAKFKNKKYYKSLNHLLKEIKLNKNRNQNKSENDIKQNIDELNTNSKNEIESHDKENNMNENNIDKKKSEIKENKNDNEDNEKSSSENTIHRKENFVRSSSCKAKRSNLGIRENSESEKSNYFNKDGVRSTGKLRKKNRIFTFMKSRRNKELLYAKEKYYCKIHKNTSYKENRIKWNEYIETKFGKNYSIGVVYKYNRNEKILFKYRPIFFADINTKKLRYSCLENGCNGKLIFDVRTEIFEETHSHSVSNQSHEMYAHPKYDEIIDKFENNSNYNYIITLREYIGIQYKDKIPEEEGG